MRQLLAYLSIFCIVILIEINDNNKVRNLPGATYTERRNLALVKKTKVKNSDRVIAPFDFNPALPKISNVLAKHHRTMHNGRK